MGIKEEKAALRAEMSGVLLRPDERIIDSRAICNRIRQLPEWASARVVLIYTALADEPDVFELWDNDKRICLPRYRADRTYEAAYVESQTELTIGQFGIREPLPGADCVDPSAVDLVIVPGVAFDAAGVRLGRGRGFYDRWLQSLAASYCGVGFDHQLVSEIPSEPHDVRMEAVVTPSGIFRAK